MQKRSTCQFKDITTITMPMLKAAVDAVGEAAQ